MDIEKLNKLIDEQEKEKELNTSRCTTTKKTLVKLQTELTQKKEYLEKLEYLANISVENEVLKDEISQSEKSVSETRTSIGAVDKGIFVSFVICY